MRDIVRVSRDAQAEGARRRRAHERAQAPQDSSGGWAEGEGGCGAVRCCGGGAAAGNGYVSRGVTLLHVLSKQCAPVQWRWWYTRANTPALQRARSESGDAFGRKRKLEARETAADSQAQMRAQRQKPCGRRNGGRCRMMQGRRARQASSVRVEHRAVAMRDRTGYWSQGESVLPVELAIGALSLRALSRPRRPIAVSSNSSTRHTHAQTSWRSSKRRGEGCKSRGNYLCEEGRMYKAGGV